MKYEVFGKVWGENVSFTIIADSAAQAKRIFKKRTAGHGKAETAIPYGVKLS